MKGGLLWKSTGGSYPYLSYGTQWIRTRELCYRDIHPLWGWNITAGYSHLPFENEADAAGAALSLYFPGLVPHAALVLGGAWEMRREDFSAITSRPRGYSDIDFKRQLLAKADYELPILYPDLPLGPVLFIQRFRLGFYGDFGFYDNSLNPLWSSGAALNMDFAALNSFSGFSIGFRFNWLWQENRAAFDILLMDSEIF